jgi:surface polysaccharide O-acyltransferase-like enzyme
MNRLAALIISIYISALIYANAFFIKTLTITESAPELFWNYLAIFMIILVPVFFLVKSLVDLPHPRNGMRHVRTALLIIALIGLSLAVLYHVIPLESVYDLPASVDKLFASDAAFTVWLILPLLVLFL